MFNVHVPSVRAADTAATAAAAAIQVLCPWFTDKMSFCVSIHGASFLSFLSFLYRYNKICRIGVLCLPLAFTLSFCKWPGVIMIILFFLRFFFFFSQHQTKCELRWQWLALYGFVANEKILHLKWLRVCDCGLHPILAVPIKTVFIYLFERWMGRQ